MSWYWIVLIVAAAVGLLLLGIGYFFFYLACVRVRQPEPTQESLLGRAVFRGHQDAVRAGWAWMSQQSFTRVETRSYDGLRLAGHYLPAPEQKGVLVLFHGYRSSWRIDFCCGLEQYRKLGLGLLVGLAVSVFQATTSIQEQTLAFIPKIVAVFVAILIFGPWMLRLMVEYVTNVLVNLPYYIG